jgi:phage terminase Nu1 subunit (DNA packaging protein)
MAETWTVAKFAREAGIDRHTIQDRLAGARVKACGKAQGRAAGGELYHFRDLFNAAVGGDIEAEKLRKTREEADKLALANARARGELVDVESVAKLGEAVFVRVRAKVLASPSLTDDEKDSFLKELLQLNEIDWTQEISS